MIVVLLTTIFAALIAELYVDSKLGIPLFNGNEKDFYIVDGYANNRPSIYNGLVTITINPKIIITNTLFKDFSKEEIDTIIMHEKGHLYLKHPHLIIIFLVMVSYVAFYNLIPLIVNIFTFLLTMPDFIFICSVVFMVSLLFFIVSFLPLILLKLFGRRMEDEADLYMLKKGGSFEPIKKLVELNENIERDVLKELNPLIRMIYFLGTKIIKMTDPHRPLKSRTAIRDFDPSSNESFIKTSLPFGIFSTMTLSSYFVKLLYEIFPEISILPAFIFFILCFFSTLAGILIYLLILYRILLYAGFNFASARLSILAYITIATLPYNFSSGINDKIIANISALAVSIYVLRKEGLFKAIAIWLIIFSIHVLVSLTWLSLLNVF